jgi:hypothetical protein
MQRCRFPLIITVPLPIKIVAWFCGGIWKLVPGGSGYEGGWFDAVLPTVAAGRPSSYILAEVAIQHPLNGCGKGVGTVPEGLGTITTCMSTATT